MVGVKGLRLRGQRVKGLGHSIGQTITVSYGIRAWSCWHLANGNKTCPLGYSRVSFFKNFVARGSQGFVGQSSPNVAYIVEQPSVLNKFFVRITIFCRVRA